MYHIEHSAGRTEIEDESMKMTVTSNDTSKLRFEGLFYIILDLLHYKPNEINSFVDLNTGNTPCVRHHHYQCWNFLDPCLQL